MTTGWNTYSLFKWMLDLLKQGVGLEVTGWYDIGHLARDLRSDFLDMFDIDADARIPITKIGFGSNWDSDYNSMLDTDLRIPTDVEVNLFGVTYSLNVFLLIFFPFMFLVPYTLRILKVPASENMPGREASSPATRITGLTEGYSWEDTLATIIALVIIVIVGGALAIFVPKMATTFMTKVFGGVGKNYLRDIYNDLSVAAGTSVNTKLTALQTSLDTVDANVDSIKADIDVGEETLTAQLSAIAADMTTVKGEVYASGKTYNLRSQVVYMRKYTEAILQYLMDPMGTARPSANEASFWIET